MKEHAVLQSLLQEWPKQAVTVSGGFHLRCWLNTWEYPVKYLGILERLEPRGHPSFHSDLDDQDPPEREEPHVIPSSQQFQRTRMEQVAGDNQAHWGLRPWGAVSESGNTRLHRQLQLPWEYSRDTLPRYWGIAEEKILFLATRQGVSYHILAVILLC